MNKNSNVPTVLIVEDDNYLKDAVRMKLENEGMKTVTARTVEDAHKYLNELEKVDAIWLDHYLPGDQNGLDLVSALKQEGSKWKSIPIFLVSNTAGTDKVQSYMRLGVNKYFTKSNHSLNEIVSEMKEYFAKSQTHYACTGSCGGVSNEVGVCQTEGCEMHGHDFVECNCTDVKHSEVLENHKSKE